MKKHLLPTLLKILTEWSIESQEYALVLFIYKTFNIGIPNKLLYKLPDKDLFFSLDSFVANNNVKKVDTEELKELFDIFKKSKYKKLENWNNSFGYII